MWMIWRARNEAFFKNTRPDPIKIMQSAIEFVTEFNLANPRHIRFSNPTATGVPQTSLNFSVFVDAGCFTYGTTCWGLCVADPDDNIIFSACKREQIQTDLVLAETLGLRWGMQTTLQQQLLKILFLTNAQIVVHCVHKSTIIAAIEPIIQDCRDLLEQMLGSCVSHIKRAKNHVAHSLVSLAKNVGGRSWSGPPPVICNTNSIVMPMTDCFPRNQ